jgi:DNA-binding transcriptional ArsR family regulator
MFLAVLEESHLHELARLMQTSPFSVMRIVDRLEIEGVVATRKLGVERRVRLNPRYFAVTELRDLLLKLVQGEASVLAAASAVRRRPRKKGKAIA